jgi:hypothetical protein
MRTCAVIITYRDRIQANSWHPRVDQQLLIDMYCNVANGDRSANVFGTEK